MKALALILCSILTVFARSETLITAAKVLKSTEHGFVLQVGTEPLGVEDNSKTKYWKGKQLVKREAFTEGDAVMCRIKTDEDPPEIREMADDATWKWLDAIKKNVQKASIVKSDAKYLTAKLIDGSNFAYRVTEKTKIKLAGKTEATLADLTPGLNVYVKARALPSLDIWASEITDTAPAAKAESKSKSKSKGPLRVGEKLNTSGTLLGNVSAVRPELRMFDIDQGGRTLHITYSSSTIFTIAGKSGKASDLQTGVECSITYRRDKTGRILASKVEAGS